jgi:tetratricopeptide (TPR) repeat protein
MTLGAILLLALWTAAPSLAPDGPAQDRAALQQKAQSALASQKWSEAADAFRALTESDPKDAQSWLNLGYALHAQGKLDEALPIHMKAAEFNATKAVASYNAACVYARQNNVEEAIAWLTKAVGARFNDANTMQNDSDLASVRSDGRFAQLLEEVRKNAANAVPQPFVITTPRASARLAYFGQRAVPQAMIDYGQPPWKPEYERMIGAGQYIQKRWRLGQDFWTHLDSSVDLSLGGVDVNAGYYYLVVMEKAADQFVLTLLDPAVVHERKLDAFGVSRYDGPGLDVPLSHDHVAKSADRLEIEWVANGDSGSKGDLVIRFGPHELRTPYELHLPAPASPASKGEGQAKKAE